jgi:hypothetical protein
MTMDDRKTVFLYVQIWSNLGGGESSSQRIMDLFVCKNVALISLHTCDNDHSNEGFILVLFLEGVCVYMCKWELRFG